LINPLQKSQKMYSTAPKGLVKLLLQRFIEFIWNIGFERSPQTILTLR
jgi:hypothetical protein